MKKISTLIFLSTLLLFTGNVSAQWADVGTPNDTMILAGFPDIAINPANDLPHVSYNQSIFVDGASLARYTGSAWTYYGAQNFTPGPALYVKLEFNPSTNEPYVAFADNTQLDRASVMKHDGGGWVNVGNAAFSNDTIRGISLAFHPTNYEPWVAFTARGDGHKLSVMKFDGSNWVYVGGQAFTASDGGLPIVSFNPTNGDAYVTWYDNSYGIVAYKYNGSSWDALPTFPNPSSAILDADFSPSGELYVFFSDYLNGKKASVSKFNGTSWEFVGTEGFTGGPAPGGSLVPAEGLVFNSSGTPYVIYRYDADDNNNTPNDLVVASFNGSSWAAVGSVIHSGVSFGYSIALSSNGTPYVVWSDQSDNFITHVQSFTSSGSAPADPTDLTASLQKMASTNVELTWTDNSNNEDGFKIERGTDGNNFTEVGAVGTDVTTYQDNGLAENTTYYYRVYAHNSFGSSGFSNVEQITTTVTSSFSPVTQGIEVYPNPANDYIQIVGTDIQKVYITDLNGRVLADFNNQVHIDLTPFAAGTYAITVVGNEKVYKDLLIIK